MVVFGEVVEHLYFTDLARASSFYTSRLGFVPIDAHQLPLQPGVSAATAVCRSRATIWLYAAIPELAFPKSASFYVNDVDELYRELIEAGVVVNEAPQREEVDEYGSQEYRFRVVDPEGNPLDFWNGCEAAAGSSAPHQSRE